MADKDNNKEVPPKSQEEDTPNKETAPENKELILGKYKTQDELVTAYKQAENKLGEQGDELREGREFAQVVQPILDLIRNDPVLFKQLDEKLRDGKSDEPSKDDTKGKESSTVQGENRKAIADLLLAKFEDKYKISQLAPEDARKLRGKVADQIYRTYGKVYHQVDLTKLDAALEDAYLLANKDKLIEKSKLEGSNSATEDEGGIPSISASPGKGGTVLTSEEATIAEKLNLTREQYLEGKKV